MSSMIGYEKTTMLSGIAYKLLFYNQNQVQIINHKQYNFLILGFPENLHLIEKP